MKAARLHQRLALWIAVLVISVAIPLAALLTLESDSAIRELRDSNTTRLADTLKQNARAHLAGSIQVLADNLVNPLYLLDMLNIRQLLASTLKQPNVSDVLVFDREGRILNHGDEALDRFGDPVDTRSLAVLDNAGGTPLFYRDGAQLVAVQCLCIGDEILGGVELRYDLTAAEAAVAELAADNDARVQRLIGHHQLTAVVLSLGMLLFGVAVASLLARQLSRPIETIVDGVRDIGSGHLETHLPENGIPELDQLAGAINAMGRRLANTTVSRDYLESILDNMQEGLVVLDGKRRIRVSNRAFQELFQHGDNPDENPDLSQLAARGRRDELRTWLDQAIAGDSKPLLETALRNRSGEAVPVSLSASLLASDQASLVCVVQDISERERQQQRIVQLAHYDSLTGLPNRVLFHDRLNHAMQQSGRGLMLLALLYLDIDFFKKVNDRFGHAYGDDLLVQIADRLRHSVREGDTVARMGGDEFTLILEAMQGVDHAYAVADKIIDLLGRPFLLHDQTIYIGCSIGIAFHPFNDISPQSLVQLADMAMYAAKQSGRSQYRVYDENDSQFLRRELALEADLRKAVAHQEFSLAYQPQYALDDDSICGVEALLRWHHPTRGNVGPNVFVPLLENLGLINKVGRWVIGRACERIATLPGHEDLRISVNLSAHQLSDAGLVEHVRQALANSGLQRHQLELEITESALMVDVGRSEQLLKQLGELGTRLAVDDFGTGYSSLSYLHRLPLHTLKLDKSFVDGLPHDANANAICRTIITLAQSMRLRVIAEGAENTEQLDSLRQLGADEVQGFVKSRPLTEDQLRELLQERAARA